ncbi:tetratricopeptide repeat protein [Microbispora sp. NBC_01389]|uniref:tetratricopeptide repeat protein n=1 Tax=Microbispora sp. NBC_01389 TaxID=2903584 RepID=UPI003247A61A
MLRAEGGFAYGAVNADVNVFQGRGPMWVLTEHRPSEQPDTATLLSQPSRMLNARFQIVDFIGRHRELDELTRWRDQSGSAVGVRWLHGPGGQGKTRLAAELAQRSAAVGWKVITTALQGTVFRSSERHEDLRLTDSAGLLVIVDYADRWPLSQFSWLFSNKVFSQGGPVRVLLLARTIRPWSAVRAELAKPPLLADTTDQALEHLSDGDLRERERMFTAARDAFAARYGLADPAEVATPSLKHPDFGLTLGLHVAALVGVDAHVEGVRPPADMVGLSVYLLDRERGHWTALYERHLEGLDFHTRPSKMDRAVFTATLTGPTTYPHAEAILRSVGLETHLDQLLDDHAVCYPAADGEAVLEPMYPDRLAEDFLALHLPAHNVAAHPPAPWAPSILDILVAREADGRPPAHAARVMTFLTAAAARDRWPHVASHLNRILAADPGLALEAGSAALIALADLVDLDWAVLFDIHAHLPSDRHIDLDAGMAAIALRYADGIIARTRDPLLRAYVLNSAAVRLRHAGMREEAATASEAAVSESRRAGVSPGPHVTQAKLYLLLHAQALINHSSNLGDLERWDSSREAAEEAIALLGKLPRKEAARHAAHRALALNNLGRAWAGLGRWDQALKATDEAIQTYRVLVRNDPDQHEPGLARSLSNAATQFSELGRPEDAVRAAQESLGIRRRLAGGSPATHLPDLAKSAMNLGAKLAQSGRRDQAGQPAGYAVDVLRELARDNPSAHDADLAGALIALGFQLEVREPEMARKATLEAVEIYRRLVAVNRSAHEPGLAAALTNLGKQLSLLGDLEAVQATTEAMSLYHGLARDNPAAYEPDLAMTLHNLSVQMLDLLHQPFAAYDLARDAVELRRRLRNDNPAAHLPALAMSMSHMARVAWILGHRDEALAASEKAQAMYRKLTRDNHVMHGPGLAQALVNHAAFLLDAGRPRSALNAAEEAVEIHRALAGTTDGSGLARALTTLTKALMRTGEHADRARSSLSEAIEILRPLAGQRPREFGGLHTEALNISQKLNGDEPS